MDSLSPLRRTAAINSGLLTPGKLRGRNYRRLFPGVYIDRSASTDLRIRSRAAYLLVAGTGVLAGYSAADLLGARCAPSEADAEVLIPKGDFREQPGLRVHRDRIADDEVCIVDNIVTTTPLRTAYDLTRWLPLVEAVVAVDALARRHGFSPKEIRRIDRRYPGARWRRRMLNVIPLANPLAESPMETRTRLALVLPGLPPPTLQHWIETPELGRARIDLAYPEKKVAIEYDGDHPRQRNTYIGDRRRDNWLAQVGWLVLHFTAEDIIRRADAAADQVRHALARRAQP